MNEPQNKQSQKKWIALSAIALIALSGGVYQLTKHRGGENADPTDGSNRHAGAAPDASEAGAGGPGATTGAGGAESGSQAAAGADSNAGTENGVSDLASAGSAGAGAAGTPGATAAVGAGAAAGAGAAGAGAAGSGASGGAGSGLGAAAVGKNLIGGAGGLSAGGAAPAGAGAQGSAGSATALGGAGAAAPGLGAPSLPAGQVVASIPRPGAVTATAPGALATTEKRDECVTVTYKHKASSAHGDDESCSHHKNMLKLTLPAEARINAASVCVRVNGIPVPYLGVKGHPDQLIFGAVAGPKSKVTARFCTGKAQGCPKEDCAIPKDEFMEAIGGNQNGPQSAKLGQWDPEGPAQKEADVMSKLDGAVKRELETNDDLNGRAPAGELYKDWIGQSESAACGAAQAKN